MARLFVTQRELDLISDLTKEVYKDINGQKIYYYPVSEIRTQTHPVYDEAIKKTCDNPIELEVMIDAITDAGTQSTMWSIDKTYKVEAFLHYRDLLDKNINVSFGDYFTYGTVLYEITDVQRIKNIYGRVEDTIGYRITGQRAREGALEVLLRGPTDRAYTDADAVQREFYQQRGIATNELGETADTRDLQKRGVLDAPIESHREVSPRGDDNDSNSFYGENK